MATGTRSRDLARASSRHPDALVRLRTLLDQTFARFGYVRVPEPEPPDEEEAHDLIVREFQLALLQSTDELLQSRSRSEMMRSAMRVLQETVEKVHGDLEDANDYAAEGPTDEERLVAEHVEDFLPLDSKNG